MALGTGRVRAVALALAAALGVAACASQQQMLSSRKSEAIDTALARGRFDPNCPAATAVVLSQDFIQPAVQGPWVGGLDRLEYTIGIEGCGQRTTLIVICQQGTESCFAANPDARFRGGQ
jgi:hypothetical protein